jgi:hypothetical protein
MADRIADPRAAVCPSRRWCLAGVGAAAGGSRVAGCVMRGCRSSWPKRVVRGGPGGVPHRAAIRSTWFCRPPCGAIGRVPAPTPTGPAIFKGAHVQPSHEEPNQECPLLFTTGRIVNHFYSRATTGRARQETGVARRLSGAVGGRRDWAGGGRGKSGPSHLPQRPSGRHDANHRHPPRGCSARSPTAIGASRRATAPTGRAGRQPAHHHRVGPSLQAAALKRPDRKPSPWAEGHRP